MHEASLTSLAILKVNWDKGQDYIQNFVPFVAEAVRRAAQDTVSVVEVQKIVRDAFGLVIPQGALTTLLKRVERAGFVRQSNKVFVRIPGAIDPSFERTRADAVRQQRALAEKLVAFCSEKHNVRISEAEAETALLGHLQGSCIPLLAASVDGCAIPAPNKQVEHAEFLVSAFVIELYEKDPIGFAFLETVMKGSMLANALFLPDIAQVKRKFEKLTAYLDTPILLRALGLEGPGVETSTKELLTLLYDLNVNLVCFEITKDEIRRVCEAAQYALRDPHHNDPHPFAVYDYLVRIGATASDVELTIANLDVSLRKLRVAIRPVPRYVQHLGLDEIRLDHIMRQELPKQREDAHRHDIDSLTAIHRLRGGTTKYNIEMCNHIFVTPNYSLAVAGAKFSREQAGYSAVPLCINDHTMATLAWVKNPTLVKDFSRHRLVSDSYAALNPKTELWRKYLEEIERLRRKGDITEQDADLLRLSTSAKASLVELTLGSAEVFSEGTVQEVLEAARAEARRETERMLAEEKSRRLTAEGTFTQTLYSQRSRVADISNFVGRWVRNIIYLIVGIAAVVGFISTLPVGVPEMKEQWEKTILAGAIVVFAVFTMWSLLVGGTVRLFARSVEVWIAEKLKNLLMSLFQIPKQ